MHKNIVLSLLLLIAGGVLLSPLKAQEQAELLVVPKDPHSFGFRAGMNYGTPVATRLFPEATGTLGFGPAFGWNFLATINSKWAIQTEVMFSEVNSSFSTPVAGDTLYEQVILGQTYFIPTFFEGAVRGDFRVQHIQIPVLANFYLSRKLRVMAGPYVAFLFNGENTGLADIKVGDNYTQVFDEPFDNSDSMRGWEVGGQFGLSYRLVKGLEVDFRGGYGFTPLVKQLLQKEAGGQYFEVNVRSMFFQLGLGYRVFNGASKKTGNRNLTEPQ